MTNKDLTIVGVLAVVLIVLMGVVIKSGGTKPPVLAPTVGSKAKTSEITASTAPAPGERAAQGDANAEHPSVIDIAAKFLEAETGAPVSPTSLNTDKPAATTEAATDAGEPPETALALALRYQSALNGLTPDSGANSSEDPVALLVSVFAGLPDDPAAEAKLAQELATAYVQSSNADEKSALLDLLLIIPSEPAMQLGETLSNSSDPDERQMGLELIANGGSRETIGE